MNARRLTRANLTDPDARSMATSGKGSQFRGVHRWTEAVPSKRFPERPRRCGFVALCDEPRDALSTVLERRAKLTKHGTLLSRRDLGGGEQ